MVVSPALFAGLLVGKGKGGASKCKGKGKEYVYEFFA
jgi:hypothetical protein